MTGHEWRDGDNNNTERRLSCGLICSMSTGSRSGPAGHGLWPMPVAHGCRRIQWSSAQRRRAVSPHTPYPPLIIVKETSEEGPGGCGPGWEGFS
jgi:hypothetical protein